MLNYQSTSFYDRLYVRDPLGLRRAPELDAWLPAQHAAGDRAKLNADSTLQNGFRMDDVKRRFVDRHVEPVGETPSQFADHIRAEIQKWAEL